jgi:hypothetical protein
VEEKNMERHKKLMEKLRLFLTEMQENRDLELLEAEKSKNSSNIGKMEEYLTHMAAVITLSCAIGELKMILAEEEENK